MILDDHITFKGAYVGFPKNTATDWHLVPLTKILVAPPPFKANFQNVDGVTGDIDLSSANGLNYSNRKGNWQFKILPGYDSEDILAEMIDFLHGGLFEVTTSSDTDGCYYKGRITVNDWKITENGAYVTLGYNLDPFRYDPTTERDYSFALSSVTQSTATYNFPRLRMPATPYIEVTSLNGTLTMQYTKCSERSTSATLSGSLTVSSVGTVDTSDMVFYSPPGVTSTITDAQIRFTASNSATVRVKFLGGKF